MIARPVVPVVDLMATSREFGGILNRFAIFSLIVSEINLANHVVNSDFRSNPRHKDSLYTISGLRVVHQDSNPSFGDLGSTVVD